MSSTTKVIGAQEGEAKIASAIRLQRSFVTPTGSSRVPLYSESLAREAEQVAKRFCSRTLTALDLKQNLFSFDEPSIEASVRKWNGSLEQSRFGQLYLAPLVKAEIGCATAACRNNTVLICRPSSPQSNMASGLETFEGFREERGNIDAQGCEQPLDFVKKTQTRYKNSVFRLLVEEAVNEWLDALESSLVQAERSLPLGAKPQVRVEQIGAKRGKKGPPEAFIEPLAAKDRARFFKKALSIGYEMYFPNSSDAIKPLSRNETWLLVRKTLQSVPLLTPVGVAILGSMGFGLRSGMVHEIA